MNILKFLGFLLCITLAIYSCNDQITEPADRAQWSEYLGGPDKNHFSSLSQIDTSNVSKLEVAWEFKSGDSGQVQCNPIIIDGVLFGVTASNQVFALNAATGVQKWRYVEKGEGSSNVNRGVTYWEDGADKRILYGYNSDLYALNAETGMPVKSFGDSGKVSLRTGLEPNTKDKL